MDSYIRKKDLSFGIKSLIIALRYEEINKVLRETGVTVKVQHCLAYNSLLVIEEKKRRGQQ